MEGSVTLKHPERALLQKTLSSSSQGFLSTFSLSRRAAKPHWHFMWTGRQPTYARVRPEDHPCHPFLATHSGKTLEDRLGAGGTCLWRRWRTASRNREGNRECLLPSWWRECGHRTRLPLPCPGDNWLSSPPGTVMLRAVGKGSAAGLEGGAEGGAGGVKGAFVQARV